MSLRLLFWAPVGVLTVLAGLWALRAGMTAATLSETDVIMRYASQYVATQGDRNPKLTDCVARPGTARGVWLVIRCVPPGGADAVVYAVDRFGGLVPGDAAAQDGGT